MRLICPNCATQYEVDDSAVPAAGREVQCGSCSSTWFQAPARSNVVKKSDVGDLPKWVEEIVEEDAIGDAPELPGPSPTIASEPNEEIVSEPEIEGLIETGQLDVPETTSPPAPAAQTAAPETNPEQDTLTAEAKAVAAKTASQAAVAAAIAANMSGTTDHDSADKVEAPETSQRAEAPASIDTADEDLSAQVQSAIAELESEQSSSPVAPEEVPAASVEAVEAVEAVEDVSTQLETAIKEHSTASSDDFTALAAEERAAAKAAEAEARTAAEAAIKEAKLAAAVDVAEKAAVESAIDAGLEKSADAASVAARTTAQISEAVVEKSTEDIEAEIKSALEKLDAGKSLPDEPGEERLSDYDVTQGDDTPEQAPSAPPVETVEQAEIVAADIPAERPVEDLDPNKIVVEQPAPAPVTELIPTDTAKEEMVEAIQRDAVADQTESLAAKLKARVAEAAKAQENNAGGTAGIVLGASAAGIAAASSRPTAFPKRETEDLASSLRPKSIDRQSLKPRLRPAATPEPKQSRFGQGFLLAVSLFAVALLIYLFRDQLATAVPALEPALTSYAGVVDNVRVIFQDAIGKLTGSVVADTQS